MNLQLITILLALLNEGVSGPILANLPITFHMEGLTTYYSDNSQPYSGYKLRIGFVSKSWLTVQLVSAFKSDVLVLKIDDFYTSDHKGLFVGHKITVADYFRNQTGLFKDIKTTKDKSTYNFSNSKQYELTMERWVGSNDGEDWNGNSKSYSIQQVCFYSSEQSFNPNTFSNHLKACYNFQINNFTSTFVGSYLKSFTWNGYVTKAFGWIDGPYLTENVYFYHQTPLFTYVKNPAVIIEIGTTQGNFGQDFYVSSPILSEQGDYYGATIYNLRKDISSGGFDNKALISRYWNTNPVNQIKEYPYTALRVSFSRNLSTYDSYDRVLRSTFPFCLYVFAQGTINSKLSNKACSAVQLNNVYPRLSFTSSSVMAGVGISLFLVIMFV